MQIDFNLAAFREIRFAAQPDIERRVAAVAAACGRGYEGSVVAGQSRPRGSVITATPRAIRDNSNRNTLITSLQAGAG